MRRIPLCPDDAMHMLCKLLNVDACEKKTSMMETKGLLIPWSTFGARRMLLSTQGPRPCPPYWPILS